MPELSLQKSDELVPAFRGWKPPAGWYLMRVEFERDYPYNGGYQRDRMDFELRHALGHEVRVRVGRGTRHPAEWLNAELEHYAQSLYLVRVDIEAAEAPF